MQVVFMSDHCRGACKRPGLAGIRSSPASDGKSKRSMAAGTSSARVPAQEIAALGRRRAGDGAGVKYDDVGGIRRSGRVAQTAQQLLNLQAFVMVDLASQRDNGERWHRKVLYFKAKKLSSEVKRSFLIRGLC